MFSAEEFGKRLKTLRNKSGYTQENLAEILETTSKTVGRLERGETWPSIEMLTLLRSEFNVSADYLLFGEDNTAQIKTALQQKIEELQKLIDLLT